MKLLKLLVLFIIALPHAWAGILYGGVEDLTVSSGYESKGDFNDMIYKLAGDVTLNGSGTWLTNPSIHEGGNPFWDHQSYDGAKMNVGYCIYGGGNCALPGDSTAPPPADIAYYATSSGGQVNDILFSASGSITATLFAKITAYVTTGWYDPFDPAHTLHSIFAGNLASGSVVSFTPTPVFGLWTNHGGETPILFSNTAGGTVDQNQTHFAFFGDPASPAPEPGTLAMLIPGAMLLAGAVYRRKRVAPRGDRAQ